MILNIPDGLRSVTILGGTDKFGAPEPVPSVELRPGDALALVGPTGSGKSELLSDIEQLALGDTVSGRHVLVNGDAAPPTATGLVATLSQRTNFVMDATVARFVTLHAESRGKDARALLPRVLETANTLCGEAVRASDPLQMLSGGQARALMIADIALISAAPVVLIDEVENAGIHKFRALEVLTDSHKIVVTATHDPVLMLMNAKRLVMRSGGMNRLVEVSGQEAECAESLRRIDEVMLHARERLRMGETLTPEDISL
ncbi:MAG: ATP-binding cassette domain-containing protein [Desulfovibrionaceae bacterium]|jgi:ABC-type lipoprotein export system ATPase subunit|nr:ATP-binding cassette domain-containing protein [Desulfovibrionaceae bacterium]